MRTLTLDEADQVSGGGWVVAIIGAGALIIAAVITACADDGAKEPVTVVVNCGPSTPPPGK